MSEHLFNKGLGGFQMNLVSLSLSAPRLILVCRLKMKIRKSCATFNEMCRDCVRAVCLSFDLSADLFIFQYDPVTIQIQR